MFIAGHEIPDLTLESPELKPLGHPPPPWDARTQFAEKGLKRRVCLL